MTFVGCSTSDSREAEESSTTDFSSMLECRYGMLGRSQVWLSVVAGPLLLRLLLQLCRKYEIRNVGIYLQERFYWS